MGGKKNGKAPNDEGSTAARRPNGWIPSRRQRKSSMKWLMFTSIPVLMAMAIAYFGAPEQAAELEPAQNGKPAGAPEAFVGNSHEAPPVDTWQGGPNDCQAWAGGGECTKNKPFMDQNCALSCAKLEYARQRYYKRCPKPEKYEPALAPGQMSSTFERIMTDFPELEPEWISRDPPVILFHNFLSVEESDAFISHGSGRYAKSLGVTMKEDGTMGDAPTEIRTSSHGWCQHPECLNDPLVQNVVTRVSNITQTPSTNAEYAQLVYYHACPTPDDPKCAFYKRHNDFIDGDEHKLQGVRIYTLFTYLNDVPEGGGTRFTDLPNGPVTFEPKRGKAVLWPSVLEDQPHSKDDRTHHEALPVTKGEKFGANFWIHQYDFKGAHAKGCTAS